jgi:hypothetical protein
LADKARVADTAEGFVIADIPERGGPTDGSLLKRKGLRRTRLRGLQGAQTWVGGITLAHNLQRMALLN